MRRFVPYVERPHFKKFAVLWHLFMTGLMVYGYVATVSFTHGLSFVGLSLMLTVSVSATLVESWERAKGAFDILRGTGRKVHD